MEILLCLILSLALISIFYFLIRANSFHKKNVVLSLKAKKLSEELDSMIKDLRKIYFLKNTIDSQQQQLEALLARKDKKIEPEVFNKVKKSIKEGSEELEVLKNLRDELFNEVKDQIKLRSQKIKTKVANKKKRLSSTKTTRSRSNYNDYDYDYDYDSYGSSSSSYDSDYSSSSWSGGGGDSSGGGSSSDW